MKSPSNRSGIGSVFALVAGTGTLLCCALPALLVALGMGAALGSLVMAFPQLTLIGEYKTPIFIVAGIVLAAAGIMQYRARFAPCPVDPALARLCRRTRRIALAVYVLAVLLYLTGFFFAYLAVYLVN